MFNPRQSSLLFALVGLVWLFVASMPAEARPDPGREAHRGQTAKPPSWLTGRAELVAQERLSNGMRVVLIANHRVPLIAMSIVYELPRAADWNRLAKLALLLEQLAPVLRTPHLPTAERTRLLLAADTTVELVSAKRGDASLTLTAAMPPDALPIALFVEADRMGFAADSLTQSAIDEAERSARRAPRRAEALREPWLEAAVFGDVRSPATEPGGQTRDPVSVRELQQFMRQYLHAGNATLVIEGPLEAKPVIRAVWDTFGRLRGGPRLGRLPPRGLSARWTQLVTGAQVWSAVSPPQFLLSWPTSECVGIAECPLGVFAEWLNQQLRPSWKQWCTRGWADHASGRFTVGCEPSDRFEASPWVSKVSEVIESLDESGFSAEALQIAGEQYWVRSVGSSSTFECRAEQVVQQLAREQAPSVLNGPPRFAPSATQVRQRVTHELLRRSTSDSPEPGEAFGSAGGSERPEVQTPDEPFWYRPPRKGPERAAVFPVMWAKRASSRLVLRQVHDPDPLVSRVVLRGLRRGSDLDPAVALVALSHSLQVGGGGPTVIERLWREHATRATWEVASNTFSVQITASPQRVEPALSVVGQALQHRVATTESLMLAKRVALTSASRHVRSLLDELLLRVGVPFATRIDSSRLTKLETRLAEVDQQRIEAFWRNFEESGEVDLAIVGLEDREQAQRIAAAALPAAWSHRTPSARPRLGPARIWIFDEDRTKTLDLELVWPSHDATHAARAALAVGALANAAKALGNLNAARPTNPTTQFTLDHRSLAEREVDTVSLSGIELDRLSTILRELDGYFARLIERIDFPQLARLGIHDLQRRQLAWFATPARTLELVHEWTLSGSLVWHPIDDYDNLGLVPRSKLLRWAETLTIPRATVIVKGPARRIETALREVHRGEIVVLEP